MGKYKTREEELLDNAKPIGIGVTLASSAPAVIGYLAEKEAKKDLKKLFELKKTKEIEKEIALIEKTLNTAKNIKRIGIAGTIGGAGIVGVHAYKHYKDKNR